MGSESIGFFIALGGSILVACFFIGIIIYHIWSEKKEKLEKEEKYPKIGIVKIYSVVCANCREPLKDGEIAVTDRVGNMAHLACAKKEHTYD